MRHFALLLLSLSALLLATELSAQAAKASSVSARPSVRSHSCMSDPSGADCLDGSAIYSDAQVEADLQSLCTEKSWMVGCTIRESCKAGTASGQYCQRWSLLAAICSDVDDNSAMTACSKYRSLCTPSNSRVNECALHVPLANQLSTAQAFDDAIELCRVMPDMLMCSQCTSKENPATTCPSPLGTVAEICLDHYMDGCSRWYEMCKTRPEGLDPICGAPTKVRTNDDDELCVGVMQMYFHGGYSDIVLFKSWIPCTAAQYAGTFMVIVFMGIFVGMVKGFRARTEQRWAREAMNSGMAASGADTCDSWQILPVNKVQIRQNMIRFFFVFLTTLIDYALMLISMTFNVGLFIAVILGFALGSLFFGHTATAPVRTGKEESQRLESGGGSALAGHMITMPAGNNTSCCTDMPL